MNDQLRTPKIHIAIIDAQAAHDYYTVDEVERFGYKYPADFSDDVVFVSFRVSFNDQAFPLRVWFKKSEVSENDWVTHARKKAADMIMWTHEVSKGWISA